MPRVARAILAGLPVHVVQRGINRQQCFFSERDYSTYLQFLAEFAFRFGCAVHAYCLMTNHVHMLVTPKAPESCALMMKNLGQHYVQTVNKRLERTGTLWEGRFKSGIVQSDGYVLACYRYIELNPVRAGMVKDPAQYRWSSYPSNAEGKPSELLKAHPSYEALGLEAAQRLTAYRLLCESAPPAPIVDEIRRATRSGAAIGKQRRGRGRPWDSQMRKMGSHLTHAARSRCREVAEPRHSLHAGWQTRSESSGHTHRTGLARERACRCIPRAPSWFLYVSLVTPSPQF
jgi:putative transposase